MLQIASFRNTVASLQLRKQQTTVQLISNFYLHTCVFVETCRALNICNGKPNCSAGLLRVAILSQALWSLNCGSLQS